MADEKDFKYFHSPNGKKSLDRREKTAVALEYEPEDVAPKVIASGKGYLAEKILDVAQQEEIPVHQDARLARSLEDVEIGAYIPPELYQVVAEVLVFVDSMDHIKGKVMDKRRNS